MFSPTTSAATTSVPTLPAHICIANQAVPDPVCTPGAILTTDASIVCRPGYSSSVRNVSVATKKKVFAEYGIPYADHSDYEVDHLISLELGGSNDISNLWPEAHNIENGSFVKDGLETHLHLEVCKGNISLVRAQAEISGNWMSTEFAAKNRFK